MHISEVLRTYNPAISFEFFPPKTERGFQELFESISALMPLKPAYVSVTYGAGGSTRERTHDLVVKLQRETDLTIVSHLTCVGSRRDEIHHILSKYQESGIHNIMALRGDPPKGSTEVQIPEDGFHFASDLVCFIKQQFPEMGVGVAGFPEGHPGTPNRLSEMDNLKRKVDAGADYICTQLFFDNRDFFDFCERCEVVGIKVPIIAGIMPIISRKGMARMSELALGARIPAKLLRAMDRAENDDYAERVGIHWATEQVVDLVDQKVKGIHFYTLNKSKATLKIYESLGIQSSESLQHSVD
ncbi:MAG: methylenetetrahydrofolate reductase [Nitrospirales bacterium]|nr:MAG: methylenetetrahydrofolate reductase [Nitrospirales bacterium]